MSLTPPFLKRTSLALVLLNLTLFFEVAPGFAQRKLAPAPVLSAKSAVILDVRNGKILYSKNPKLRLPPASTTKMMTAILVLEKFPITHRVTVSKNAANAAPSRAGLVAGVQYTVGDLLKATLVSSSNDAAVALAEAVAQDETAFSLLMNEKAKKLGMHDTHFINASGLPMPRLKQYSTAFDLALLMRQALRDKRIDFIMGMTEASIRGSDRKLIVLRSHNKMLWKTPKFVKGKTGWTYASRHTFIGTDYDSKKTIAFAMLSSQKPWTDIQQLASFGLASHSRR